MNSSEAIFPALDRAEEHLDVIIEVRSFKHDCHVTYKVSQNEIDKGLLPEIIRNLKYRLQDFIQEKINATSEKKSREVQARLLN